nr:hypothetical protein CFP56_19332 [Quercus suber]
MSDLPGSVFRHKTSRPDPRRPAPEDWHDIEDDSLISSQMTSLYRSAWPDPAYRFSLLELLNPASRYLRHSTGLPWAIGSPIRQKQTRHLIYGADGLTLYTYVTSKSSPSLSK